MDLTTFDRELRTRLPEGGWPFVCDGSPLDCDGLVVGFNPATAHDIWPY
jgi:hypothetical protein